MWPFQQKLDTGCASAVYVHSDKNHLWSPWESYRVDGMAYSIIFRSGIPYTEEKQRRVCQICGYKQIEDIE